MSNQRVKLNWVLGPNTKTMKKVFPILPYLKDDDIIIYVDDDIIFPRGFVESRIGDFKNSGCKFAISGNTRSKNVYSVFKQMTGIQFNGKSSATSLVTKRMLNGYQVLASNPDVYQRGADDSLYTSLCVLNGFQYIPCSDYAVSGKCKNPISPNFNPVCPLSQQGVFLA